jgi:hypothetical protein
MSRQPGFYGYAKNDGTLRQTWWDAATRTMKWTDVRYRTDREAQDDIERRNCSGTIMRPESSTLAPVAMVFPAGVTAILPLQS